MARSDSTATARVLSPSPVDFSTVSVIIAFTPQPNSLKRITADNNNFSLILFSFRQIRLFPCSRLWIIPNCFENGVNFVNANTSKYDHRVARCRG
ncbi:hypothetical protein Trydic_g13732 [Trypoxylus dichotomus]